MTGFVHFIATNLIQCMKEMGKGAIKLTCAGIVNIMKYIPGVQGVDEEEVYIRPFPFLLIPDELKTQKMCSMTLCENLVEFFVCS